MKPPAIHRRNPPQQRHSERGVTIALVAIALVGIMAMAALSIDVVTLYLANAEAQRSADAAALAAARILSISGMTGDPTNSPIGASTNAWQQACQLATQVATAVAQQNTVGGVTLPAAQVNVTYPNNTDNATCSGTDPAFGVNPLVTVKVQRTNLPTFFARIWGHRGASVSATATAEAFNSSNSASAGNMGVTGTLTPAQPRCVKPWLIPNHDPTPGMAQGPFISAVDGSLQNSGIRVTGTSNTGVIGESFSLIANCNPGPDCQGKYIISGTPTGGYYVPASISGTPVAAASCASGTYQEAIAGCDQGTIYACGVPGGNQADLSINPVFPNALNGETSVATQCLIHQSGAPAGEDLLDTTVYPYQIRAGFGNPLVQSGAVNSSKVITASDSIATIPIYNNDFLAGKGPNPPVTIVGFLQVFITQIDGSGNVDVTVLNVSGCGAGSVTPGPPVTGTSPVPVRLINYP